MDEVKKISDGALGFTPSPNAHEATLGLDLNREKPLALAEAAKLVPSTRRGKPTHVATLTRWIVDGCHGVRLEAMKLGGKWITSAEALQRFAERCTAARMSQAPAASPAEPTRRNSALKAEQALDAMGI